MMKKSLTKYLRILASVALVAASGFLIFANGSFGQANVDFTLEDFQGRSSLVVFAGTYCPHCHKVVPEIETQIWNVYKNDLTIWLQVVDGANGKTFDTKMPQGRNKHLSYEALTEETCNYVPSWVLMDANGKPVLTSCGTERSVEDMANGIEDLLSTN